MQTDKIIAAIAAYLEEETAPSPREDRLAVEFGGVINRGHFTHAGFCQEIAAEIAAAIAPLVEAGEADWEAAPEWANYTTTFDGKRYFFEDIFYPCRFIRGDSKTIWKGDFETQAKNASWDGTIERRPQ